MNWLRRLTALAFFVVASISSSALAESEKVAIFGQAEKTQNCEKLQSATITEIPVLASEYLRIVCVRGSQFVAAAGDWQIISPAYQETVFPPYWGRKLHKGRLFTSMTVRSVPTDEARNNLFASHRTDKKIQFIGQAEQRPDPFAASARKSVEGYLESSELGDNATIIEIGGEDGVLHTIYFFINERSEFAAASLSVFGESQILWPLTVSRRGTVSE